MLSRKKKITKWNEECLFGLSESRKDLHDVDFNNKIQVDVKILIRIHVKAKPFWKFGRVIEISVKMKKMYIPYASH